MLLNIFVLVCEVLFYSLFIYFAKKEGRLWRYILGIILVILIIGFLGSQTFLVYSIQGLLFLFVLKYIVRINTKVFDLVLISLSFIIKAFIEIICVLILMNFVNTIFVYIILSLIKVGTIYFLRNKIEYIYNKLFKKWNSNNFYIRYGSSIIIMIYFIVFIVFILSKIITVL